MLFLFFSPALTNSLQWFYFKIMHLKKKYNNVSIAFSTREIVKNSRISNLCWKYKHQEGCLLFYQVAMLAWGFKRGLSYSFLNQLTLLRCNIPKWLWYSTSFICINNCIPFADNALHTSQYKIENSTKRELGIWPPFYWSYCKAFPIIFSKVIVLFVYMSILLICLGIIRCSFYITK